MFQNPVAHCWTEEKSIKGKFCNVCRKKMQEVPGVRCEGEYVRQSVDGKILKSLFAAQHQKKISLKNCVRIRPGKVTFLFFSRLTSFAHLFIIFCGNLFQIVYVSKLLMINAALSSALCLISSILISVCDYFIHEHCQVIIS